jgi:protein-tyrosine-phosphatase
MPNRTNGERGEIELDVEYALRVVIAELTEQYRGQFNAETVERFVRDSYASLRQARIQQFVPVLTERFTKDRLRALAKVESGVGNQIPHVLFLCVHNAGRSQMAAGWMKQLAGDRVAVYSGGSEPSDALNRAVVEAMAEVGVDIAQEFPKPWTDEVVRAADVVVTMGCGDACPVFPGVRYVDWEVEDPAGQSVEAVRPIRDDLGARVEGLMAELGITATAAGSAAAGGE